MNIEINKEVLNNLKNIVKKGERRRKGGKIFLKKNINKSYYVLLVFMVGLASISVYTQSKKYKESTELINESVAPVFSSNEIQEDNQLSNINIEQIISKELNTEFVPILEKDNLKSVEYLDGITKIETLGNEKIYNMCDGGIVENIYLDYAYGYTIVVRYSDNLKVKYSNLDSDVYVTFGQELKKGDVIGRSVNYSLMDESYVFLKVDYKNEAVNINKLLGM